MNENNIENFIQEYSRSRVIIETTVRATLKRAAEYEEVFDKDFYVFNKDEALHMFKGAGAISLTSLQNQKLTLTHAARFYLDQQGKPTDNIYEEISKEDLAGCIDNDKKRNRIITRNQLNDIQANLWNSVDIALLEMLFRGCTNGQWAKDLMYLRPEQISKSDMCVYLRSGYVIPIDNRAYKIIMDGFSETELMSYTPEMKVVSVSAGSLFKQRFNTIIDSSNTSDQKQLELRYRYLQRRLNLMSEYLGIKMTTKSLNQSGFLHYSQEEMRKLEIEDFKQYLRTESGRNMAARYGWHGPNYVSVISDKFKDYI